MGRFKDLLKGKKAAPAPAPKVEAAPAPEPVVEEVVVEAPVEETAEAVALEELSKDELEVYGRTLGIELDKRRSKATLIEELHEAEEGQE